jgi:hypothetical protein
VKTLKVNGTAEADRLLRRTRRALAMGRIYPADADYICDRLEEIKARIVNMTEKDAAGEEVQ